MSFSTNYKAIIILLNKFYPVSLVGRFFYYLALRYLTHFFSNNPNILKLYITGSYIQNRMIYGISDIDFLVVTKYDFDKNQNFREFASKKLSKFKIFGTFSDINKNIISIEELSQNASHPRQKFILNEIEKKEVFSNSTESLEFQIGTIEAIKYFESRIVHLVRKLLNKEKDKRFIKKESEFFNNYFSRLEQFSLSHKFDSTCVKSSQELLESIISLEINDENQIDINIDSKSVISFVEKLEGDEFDWPFLTDESKDLVIEFSHTDNISSFLENYDFQLLRNSPFAIKFKSFMYFNGSHGSRVLLKTRAPYLWGEKKISSIAIKSIKESLNYNKEFLKRRYYQKFFENDSSNFSYLDYFSEENITKDSNRFRFFIELFESHNVVGITNQNFYKSVNFLKSYFLNKKIEEVVKDNRVSACVCIRDRASYLKTVLDCFINQDIPLYEVIVVDHDSKDNTREVLEEYSKKMNLKFETVYYPNLNCVRDHGVKMATGDVVAFADDDVKLPSDWHTHIKESFDCDEHLSLLGGSVLHWKQDNNSGTELFHRYFLGEKA